LAGTGLATGLALTAKFSTLLLLAIFCFIVALPIVIGVEALGLPSGNKPLGPGRRVVEGLTLLALILVIAFVTIPLAYGMEGFTHWISGMKHLWSLTKAGRRAFFFGEYSYEGWWNYFIVAFFIKTPVGSLVLIAASLVLFRAGTPLRLREVLYLLLPPLLVFAAGTQAQINIGLRHILPVYPFLFLLAGRLGTVEFARRSLNFLLIAAPLVLTAFSTLRISPHQLAYFNEFVGGADQGYRYLSDSNLDWGQDLKGLKAYMNKERLPIIYLSYFGTAPPSYYGIRYQYIPGSWPLEWPPPAD
jgi:hypothetical protein